RSQLRATVRRRAFLEGRLNVARAKQAARLAGVFPAAITPHRPGTWEPDFTAALDLMDFLAQRGADGICLLGSTGEFLHFDFARPPRLASPLKKPLARPHIRPLPPRPARGRRPACRRRLCRRAGRPAVRPAVLLSLRR